MYYHHHHHIIAMVYRIHAHGLFSNVLTDTSLLWLLKGTTAPDLCFAGDQTHAAIQARRRR